MVVYNSLLKMQILCVDILSVIEVTNLMANLGLVVSTFRS
jgi:hypothetical protein